jgi:hypothetical protein
VINGNMMPDGSVIVYDQDKEKYIRMMFMINPETGKNEWVTIAEMDEEYYKQNYLYG